MDDLSRRTFKFDHHPDSVIRFIDLKGLIGSCSFPKAYGRDVVVAFDPAYQKKARSLDMIISNIELHGDIYKIFLQQTATGAVGYIELKNRRKYFKITKFRIGYF